WQDTINGDIEIRAMTGSSVKITKILPNITADLHWQLRGVGDFNGDGTSDIIWQNETTGQICFWLMNDLAIKDAGFYGPVDSQWQIVGTGDFNADKKYDVMWRNIKTNDMYLWVMDGMTILRVGLVVKGLPVEWRSE
ncbi:FG-GAP repeat domain-containing protein, partial [Candidatus Magnetobacterium casense]